MNESATRNYNNDLLKLLDDFRQRIIDGTCDVGDFLSIVEKPVLNFLNRPLSQLCPSTS